MGRSGGHSSKFITLASCRYISSFSHPNFPLLSTWMYPWLTPGPKYINAKAGGKNGSCWIQLPWILKLDSWGGEDRDQIGVDRAFNVMHRSRLTLPLCNINPCFPPVSSRYLPLTAIKRIDFAGYTDVAFLSGVHLVQSEQFKISFSLFYVSHQNPLHPYHLELGQPSCNSHLAKAHGRGRIYFELFRFY